MQETNMRILKVIVGLSVAGVLSAAEIDMPEAPPGTDITRENVHEHLAYANKLVSYYDFVLECNVKANYIASQMRLLKHKWLGIGSGRKIVRYPTADSQDSNVNYNLFDNLAALQEDQTKMHTTVKSFIDKFLEVDTNDPIALSDALSKLHSENRELIRDIQNISVSESHFLQILDHILWSIENFTRTHGEDNKILRDQCVKAKAKVTNALKTVDQHKAELTEIVSNLRALVSTFRSRRDLLVSYAYKALERLLSQAHEKFIKDKAFDVRKSLVETVEFFKLEDEVFEWRYSLGRQLGYSKYLQFEHPIRIRLAQKEIALQFLDRIDNYPLAPGKEALVSTINSLIGLFDAQVKSYRQEGWLGQLSKQAQFVKTYDRIAHTLADQCIPALNKYKEYGDVTSLRQFRDIEFIYAEVVDSCIKRGAQ